MCDEIRHSWDHRLNPVTCSASTVLEHGTGYCYAKSHLLAALLRANGIPAGLCHQCPGIADGRPPYCLHGLNAVHLAGHGWYRIDARGNKPGIDAQFTPPVERLPFPTGLPGEADLPGIHVDAAGGAGGDAGKRRRLLRSRRQASGHQGRCASVPMASVEKNAAAKSFAVKAGKPNIYVYRNESMGAAFKLPLFVDGRAVGDTAAKIFLLLEVAPGNHTLVSKGEYDSVLPLTTSPGKNYYVWQEVKIGLFGPRSALQLVDEATGRAGATRASRSRKPDKRLAVNL